MNLLKTPFHPVIKQVSYPQWKVAVCQFVSDITACAGFTTMEVVKVPFLYVFDDIPGQVHHRVTDKDEQDK